MGKYQSSAVRMHKIAGPCMTFVMDEAQTWCENNISGTNRDLVSVSIGCDAGDIGNNAYALITYTEPAWFDSKTGKEAKR